MNKLFAGVALVAIAATSLNAQTENAAEATEQVTTAAPVIAAPEPAKELVLNSGTPITLAVAEEVNSSTHKEGDTFKLTVLNDVKIDQTVVIPRGTPAVGEITWRTGKGAFGKSGKLDSHCETLNWTGQKYRSVVSSGRKVKAIRSQPAWALLQSGYLRGSSPANGRVCRSVVN